MQFLLLTNQLKPVTTWEYFVLFLIAFGCFLIGWYFSKKSSNRKYNKLLAECNEQKARLINSNIEPTIETSEKGGVRAIKTRGRAGKPVGQSEDIDTSALNFERFGTADASQKDDLKRIKGVGPFIENKLNAIGIFTFDQISKFNTEDMQTVTELIAFFPGRIERDDWKGQAEVLKKGGDTDFSKRMSTTDDS